jgi:hypothetical protein
MRNFDKIIENGKAIKSTENGTFIFWTISENDFTKETTKEFIEPLDIELKFANKEFKLWDIKKGCIFANSFNERIININWEKIA